MTSVGIERFCLSELCLPIDSIECTVQAAMFGLLTLGGIFICIELFLYHLQKKKPNAK